MPGTTTVAVDREAIIDAIGTLYAAEHFFVVLNGNIDSRLGDFFAQAASDLKATLGHDAPAGDDEYAVDPLIVELDAQSHEKTAELLKRLANSRELIDSIPTDVLWQDSLKERVRAERIREAGNINAGTVHA